jgi:hypothetical protein
MWHDPAFSQRRSFGLAMDWLNLPEISEKSFLWLKDYQIACDI